MATPCTLTKIRHLRGERSPLDFWKMMVMEDSEHNKPRAAYRLSQGQLLRKLLEDRNRAEAVEGFVLGPYRTFQIAITDLRSPAATTSMR
jgi:endonuclease G